MKTIEMTFSEIAARRPSVADAEIWSGRGSDNWKYLCVGVTGKYDIARQNDTPYNFDLSAFKNYCILKVMLL